MELGKRVHNRNYYRTFDQIAHQINRQVENGARDRVDLLAIDLIEDQIWHEVYIQIEPQL